MPTAKGEATKARILETAVDLLVRGGKESASLDGVLGATRTSKGQLFHYFPGGKQQLLTEATRRQTERMLDENGLTGLTTWEAWRSWFDTIIALHREQAGTDSCEVAAIAGRTLDANPEERAILRHAFDLVLGRVGDGLREMRTARLLRQDAPVEAMADLVLATIQGGAVVDKATGSSRHLESALGAVFDYLRSFAE